MSTNSAHAAIARAIHAASDYFTTINAGQYRPERLDDEINFACEQLAGRTLDEARAHLKFLYNHYLAVLDNAEACGAFKEELEREALYASLTRYIMDFLPEAQTAA